MKKRQLEDHPARRGAWHLVEPAVRAVAVIAFAVILAALNSHLDAAGPSGHAYEELPEYRTWSVIVAISLAVWFLIFTGPHA